MLGSHFRRFTEMEDLGKSASYCSASSATPSKDEILSIEGSVNSRTIETAVSTHETSHSVRHSASEANSPPTDNALDHFTPSWVYLRF